MPKVNFVKSARVAKPEAGIKVGDSYYWWGVMVGNRGVRRYSKTKPTRSMLTQSEFLSTIYDLEDGQDWRSADSPEALQSMRDELVENLRQLGEEQSDKQSNLPDNLQYSSTGELLTSRADACDNIADEFDNVVLDDYDNELEDHELDEIADEVREELGLEEDAEVDENVPEYVAKVDAKIEEKLQEWISEKVDELEAVSWDYE